MGPRAVHLGHFQQVIKAIKVDRRVQGNVGAHVNPFAVAAGRVYFPGYICRVNPSMGSARPRPRSRVSHERPPG